MFNDFITRLNNELVKTLPGEDAHLKMASTLKNFSASFDHHGEPVKNSAVCILLFPENNEWHSVLIKRPEYQGYHSGQIGLPGGKVDINDVDLKQTALREVREEIGVDELKIKIIGQLSDLYIPVSNIKVTPFIGCSTECPVFQIDPYEVVELIKFPVNMLLSAKSVKQEKMTFRGFDLDVPYYDIQGYHVWGATAMILSEFCEIVRPVIQV